VSKFEIAIKVPYKSAISDFKILQLSFSCLLASRKRFSTVLIVRESRKNLERDERERDSTGLKAIPHFVDNPYVKDEERRPINMVFSWTKLNKRISKTNKTKLFSTILDLIVTL
jgi:hypothetical protein